MTKATSERLHPNMSLRRALRRASAMGMRVEKKRKTGEYLVHDSLQDETVLLNGRNKDAGRNFVAYLKKGEELRQ